ncbi:MAG TPA: EamA family transporter [Magnetospirillum sp.]|jgi:drug/metabolite transporter (DMT)-like permease|nr:EamA family transporter [Magnetospirillum sp.]
MFRTVPLKVILGLAAAIVLDTITQLAWKEAVGGLGEVSGIIAVTLTALHNPLFLGVVGLMLCQFLNWMLVLEHSDLSYAHAITALSYVTVAAASVPLLGERISLAQGIGIALIMAGVALVSRTGHNTYQPPGELAP